MLRTPRARRAFTLLEVLLAALIAGLLMAALYAAMYSTLQQTQATREAVESEALARGVFNRINTDLTGTLSPLPPKSGGNSAASGGTQTTASAADTGAAAGATDATGAAGATGADPAAAAGTDPAAAAATGDAGATTTPGATDSATALSADYAFQGGVVGEETRLVIYAGRTPEVFGRSGGSGDQVRADQRQIIYWLEPGRGLYRRERPWVTADGVRNGIEADPDAPDSVLLAEEAVALTFAYSDGPSGEWASSWDGTAPGPDGVTPLGPPRAIKVTIDLKITTAKGDPLPRQVTQVIAVRSAPGTYTPPLLEAPTDGASDSGAAAASAAADASSGSGAASGAAGGGASSSGAGGKTGGSATGGGATGGGKTGGGATGGGATGGGATGGGSTGGGKTGGGATGGGSTGGGRTGGGATGGGGR